ncbi:hypothetical protein DMA11_06720 [Marinilabiliaceae bacterium JC017]|nr:hypothetical protein DMA11_06720 [Marinilabiliaceae bacterium JC017]
MKSTSKTMIHLFTVLMLVGASMNACAQDILDEVNKTFPNITSISVEGSFCNVEVNGYSGHDVELQGVIKSTKDYDIKIRYEERDNELKVWIDRPKSIWGSINGKLTFKVPASTNIHVDNSSGSIYVENIGQSEVKLKASSGNVKVKNIDTDLLASASSGSLYLEDVTGNVKSKTSSGSQQIIGVNGDLTTEASSGSIKVEGIGGNAEIKTSSGGQLLYMIEGDVQSRASSGSLKIDQVTGDLTANTTSGGIKLDRITGAVSLSSSSGSQRGVNIKLTGHSSFKSSSGSISMELLNDTNELSFELSASSGSLSAKGTSGRNSLVIKKGPIKIFGNSSSGSQSYK